MINSKEQKEMKNIDETYYMKPILKKIGEKIRFFVQENNMEEKNAWREVLSHLSEIFSDSKKEGSELQKERKNRGEIKDVPQAMKCIAGNAFSKAIQYLFLKNKQLGNIKNNIFITSKKAGFKKITTVYIGEETQKPDIDLIVYTLKENENPGQCIFLSLKTSLRERAGQTFKWKLLLEIAQSENDLKDKYQISYDVKPPPLMCLVTLNFYDEINQPQIRGMFPFFDGSFIAKSSLGESRKVVSPLSHFVCFINKNL